MSQPDIIIIGTGMGGATVATSLAPSGKNILILERGERLLSSPAERDETAIFRHGVFRHDEWWIDGAENQFSPGNYYYVGGNTKFFGAVLIRYRAEDFSPIRHAGGITFGWPISYDDIEPWYAKAEALYQVRGVLGEDPTEPPHSSPYPFRVVPDEPVIADLRRRLRDVGLNPSSLPLGVDIERWLAGGQTPWDGFPDTYSGKMDAETVGITKALSYPNVMLKTGSLVTRLHADEMGRISGVEVQTENNKETLSAPIVILAAGAVQTAALLLRSANSDRPIGCANSSDQVGRNFMNHNCSAVLALHPLRRNCSVYQKTLTFNDFYLDGGPDGTPLGNVQLLGKISGPILSANSSIPGPVARWIANRSVDFYAMSEDLPTPESRVTLKDGQIMLDWKRSNWDTHLALVARLKQLLHKAGFPITFSKPFDRRTPSHQCGTARMGNDPRTSVVDTFCRCHDHPNLFITDASVLPTSAAVNPALTIAALAMRVADHIIEREFSS